MDQPHKTSGKAFYVLLCAIMGALLFIVLQRALALIGYLLINTNSSYSLGLSPLAIAWINYLTFLAAIFGGLWYGVWLGLHWYEIVYEKGSGGWFHGFRGHWLNNGSKANSNPAPAAAKPAVKAPADKAEAWDLDDLLKKELPPAPKPAKAKVAVKSTTRRKAASRSSV